MNTYHYDFKIGFIIPETIQQIKNLYKFINYTRTGNKKVNY